jgi:hypothetical protein
VTGGETPGPPRPPVDFLSLADQVDVAPQDGKQHVVHTLIAAPGRVAARVAFLNEAEFDKLARKLNSEMRAATASSSGTRPATWRLISLTVRRSSASTRF